MNGWGKILYFQDVVDVILRKLKRGRYYGRVMRVWVWRAFAQGEAYVSAEPERERVHGVDDSVPDRPIPSLP